MRRNKIQIYWIGRRGKRENWKEKDKRERGGGGEEGKRRERGGKEEGKRRKKGEDDWMKR